MASSSGFIATLFLFLLYTVLGSFSLLLHKMFTLCIWEKDSMKSLNWFLSLTMRFCQMCLEDIPGIVHVIPNRVHNLHTTRSWNFLQVNSHISNGILSRSQSGSGSIIGIIDTGQGCEILTRLQSVLDQEFGPSL
ncbi:unnamed protein product [Prunus armeniaca]|uniref:Uncharacterized protein n=1 Tax=Prunus armeniaca TaxID=36596 RepID=A0A6J5Y2Q6_PRUAR|nr:unnamed protein product [Prunus armeniaca]